MNATLAGVEELKLFPTDAAREKAIDEYASSIRGWDLGLGILIFAAIGIALLLGVRLGIGTLMQWWPWIGRPMVREPLTFAIIGVCMFLALRVLHRMGVRKAMRRKLVESGVPVCLGCGYLLQGLSPESTTCPECGMTIEARVRVLLEVQPAGLQARAKASSPPS